MVRTGEGRQGRETHDGGTIVSVKNKQESIIGILSLMD